LLDEHQCDLSLLTTSITRGKPSFLQLRTERLTPVFYSIRRQIEEYVKCGSSLPPGEEILRFPFFFSTVVPVFHAILMDWRLRPHLHKRKR
jgi:hypothetical protein